jgi:hypothetical protein
MHSILKNLAKSLLSNCHGVTTDKNTADIIVGKDPDDLENMMQSPHGDSHFKIFLLLLLPFRVQN